MLKNHLLAWLISLAFFFCYSTISLKLYANHQTRGDLTAYAQGMWNTLHGHFMASTYNYSVHNYYDNEFREINETNSNIFGIHFNPIILAFLPLYSLIERPETLLVIQALLVSGGGFIIYLIANDLLKNRFLSLSLSSLPT